MPVADNGPRVIHPDEFEETMELVNRCFGFESGELEARMPHCFDEAHPERHAIIERNGEVVSHVVCVPAEICATGAKISCLGIAGVATDPDYRGNGYMTQLIEFGLDRLYDRGVPVVELEGGRPGYGRFGWENAGRELWYRITDRAFDLEADDTDAVREYRTAIDRATIQRLHGDERYRILRDKQQYELMFAQKGLNTLIYDEGDPAYLCYRGLEPASVLEFGGSVIGVATLRADLLERSDEIVLYRSCEGDCW